jgi:hypothetical protein
VESDQDSAYFGYSVAGAGDVNGDGFSDVIIGAYGYDGEAIDGGAAFIFLGSPSGLGTSPAWTAESDQASSNFGISVACAGDVNGDGFSDVIVGAYLYDSPEISEGRAFAYYGSPTGPAEEPSWVSEGDQIGALYGHSVSTAGDVNGDGYSDVLVGATSYDNGEDNEGGAFVYHGSPNGLSSQPDWTAETNQVFAHMGFRVSTAGDVNGDGFSDVILGAPEYDDGEVDEGRAYVFGGSSGGLSSSPMWTVESNQSGGWMGFPVASAGDVNGDGFSDVVVGAINYDHGQSDEGRVHLYYGSPTGPLSTAAWIAEGDQDIGEFGFSLAAAGDVNGDGFVDLISGAPGYDSGQWNEGKCFFYFGNLGDGPHRLARMLRTDDSTPIWLLGESDAPTAFRLRMLGRNPAGGGKVTLQVEVKPAEVPFDGADLVTGLPQDTNAHPNGAVPLNHLVTGLTPERLYRWRLRTLTDSPFFPRSPWFWLPYNAATEADLRMPAAVAAVPEESVSPVGLELGPAAPNPFQPSTEIRYFLPQGGRVQLRIFDVLGRQVAALVAEPQTAGYHAARWDGRDRNGRRLAAGTYFAELEFGGTVEARKLVMLK